MKNADANLQQKANILKGLAHPARIAIAEMLADREICACEIAGCFSLDRTTVSKHLALMTRLGILTARRDAQNVYYTLGMRCLISALQCIDGVLQRGSCSGEELECS